MSASFEERLNKVIDRLLSKELLANEGLGNEIGFYIFDYPPEKELQVREFMGTVQDQIHKRMPSISLRHINLFELLIEYLKERKLLDRAFKLQKDKGNEELIKALKGPLHEQKIAKYFVEKAKPEEHDLILMSGIGNSWPILRSHTLLNSLHPFINDTPLVVFYPGKFDGQGLRLFERLKESNYYRAFQLVP
ncbi:DUF1788 domain-containing protein [Maridesulfovibrio sp.]|uniref:DUF1788 domain-containing protein n=1 Tax=Maridesulfovibrio sp. TaxID=2795000 RepID=UPI0029CA80D1|nr:DUF1788 domain-containing protein [Maridesulfovibrio sp.]